MALHKARSERFRKPVGSPAYALLLHTVRAFVGRKHRQVGVIRHLKRRHRGADGSDFNHTIGPVYAPCRQTDSIVHHTNFLNIADIQGTGHVKRNAIAVNYKQNIAVFRTRRPAAETPYGRFVRNIACHVALICTVGQHERGFQYRQGIPKICLTYLLQFGRSNHLIFSNTRNKKTGRKGKNNKTCQKPPNSVHKYSRLRQQSYLNFLTPCANQPLKIKK